MKSNGFDYIFKQLLSAVMCFRLCDMGDVFCRHDDSERPACTSCLEPHFDAKVLHNLW